MTMIEKLLVLLVFFLVPYRVSGEVKAHDTRVTVEDIPVNLDLEDPELVNDPFDSPFDEAAFAAKAEYYTSNPGKHDWNKIVKGIIADFTVDTLALGGTIWGAVLVTRKLVSLHNTAPPPPSVQSNGAAQLDSAALAAQASERAHNQMVTMVGGLTGVISTYMAGVIRNPLNTIRNGRRTPKSGLEAFHNDLVKETLERVEGLPLNLKYKVRELDHLIRSLIAQDLLADALILMRQRQKEYLHFPNVVRDVGTNRELEDSLKKLVQFYPDSSRKVLLDFTQMVRKSSSSDEGLKPQIILQGPKGTGKTEFVNLLGQILGLHVCRINLNDLEKSTDLSGKKEPWDRTHRTVGKIAECYVEAGHLNPIIFFDEAGNAVSEDSPHSIANGVQAEKKSRLLAELKVLLNPELRDYSLDGMGGHVVPIRHAIFVIATNDPIHPDLAEGGRMPTIHLEYIDTEAKYASLAKTFKEYRKLFQKELSRRQLSDLTGALNNSMPKIIDENEKRRIPGVRILQGVAKFVVFRFSDHIKDKSSPLEDEEISETVSEGFDLYSPIDRLR